MADVSVAGKRRINQESRSAGDSYRLNAQFRRVNDIGAAEESQWSLFCPAQQIVDGRHRSIVQIGRARPQSVQQLGAVTFGLPPSRSGVALEEVEQVERPKQQRRSEEHTSELQSRPHLVCRLLLE